MLKIIYLFLIKEIVGDNNPEFWKDCKCPFFTVPVGHKRYAEF